MKKILALLIVAIMLFGLISCGGGNNPQPETPPDDSGNGNEDKPGEGGNEGGGSGGEEKPGDSGDVGGDEPVTPPVVGSVKTDM